MKKAQHITGKTAQGDHVDIVVIEHTTGNFGVLMSGTAFPVGTAYPTADDAAGAAVTALNRFMAPDKIAALRSAPIEEFVTNERLGQLV